MHEHYVQYYVLISSEQGRVIVYSCVSSPSQKKDLVLQKEVLQAYCMEHGIKVDQWVVDIGSALDYKRIGIHRAFDHIERGGSLTTGDWLPGSPGALGQRVICRVLPATWN